MIWLAGSLGYAAMGCTAARVLAGHFAWRMHACDSYRGKRAEPSGEQWFGAWASALCLAFVWPLVAITMLVPWRMGAEREAILAERERRIAETEKELGLR